MFLLCDNLSFSQSFLMFEPSFLTSLLCNTRHYPMISPIRMSLVNCSFRIVFFWVWGTSPPSSWLHQNQWDDNKAEDNGRSNEGHQGVIKDVEEQQCETLNDTKGDKG